MAVNIALNVPNVHKSLVKREFNETEVIIGHNHNQ